MKRISNISEEIEEENESLLFQVEEGFFLVPLLAESVPAGKPISCLDASVQSYESVSKTFVKHPNNTFMMTICGESMEPELYSGQKILLDKTLAENVHNINELNGKIILASINNELTLKRLCLSGKNIILKPENPEYKNIKIGKYDDFRVCAVLTWAMTSYI